MRAERAIIAAQGARRIARLAQVPRLAQKTRSLGMTRVTVRLKSHLSTYDA